MSVISRCNLSDVERQMDKIGLNNYKDLKYKFFITNSALNIDNFIKIQSIDEIPIDQIKESLFYLYFDTDDLYVYHLDKIIKYNGKFLTQINYGKYNYVHANKNCKLAVRKTIDNDCKRNSSNLRQIQHANICQALEQTRDLPGSYVEIGVYKGDSALTAINYMKYSNIIRESYFLDTYEGFDYTEAVNSSETHWKPNNNSHKIMPVDEHIKYVKDLLGSHSHNNNFNIVKSNICKDKLPDNIKNIAVANIDVDLYDATRDALEKVAPKIVKGGIIIAEDPTSTPYLIGAFYAMEKFLKTEEGKKFMKLHLLGQYFLIKMK